MILTKELKVVINDLVNATEPLPHDPDFDKEQQELYSELGDLKGNYLLGMTELREKMNDYQFRLVVINSFTRQNKGLNSSIIKMLNIISNTKLSRKEYEEKIDTAQKKETK